MWLEIDINATNVEATYNGFETLKTSEKFENVSHAWPSFLLCDSFALQKFEAMRK